MKDTLRTEIDELKDEIASLGDGAIALTLRDRCAGLKAQRDAQAKSTKSDKAWSSGLTQLEIIERDLAELKKDVARN